jgi:hypothetical protein
MALLKTSKSPVGGLTTLRDDLKNMLKPSAPTFANVSTESFHDFATAPNAQLIDRLLFKDEVYFLIIKGYIVLTIRHVRLKNVKLCNLSNVIRLTEESHICHCNLFERFFEIAFFQARKCF